MKTEPPDLSLAAPPSFAANSVSQVANHCQPEQANPTEKGKPGLVWPPRLPSLPFPLEEHKRLEMTEDARLGNTAIYPTPPQNKDLVLGAFRLLTPMHKLYIQDFNSDQPVLKHGKTGWPHRSCFCYHSVIPGLVGVELRRAMDNPEKVGLGGVQHCGDIWKCPVCGLYSALRWQGEVIETEKALRQEGYRLLLCVLTISHDTDTTLEEEIEILRAAYTALFQQQKKSQKKRADRYGIVGRMRAWDVIYGVHGWHAHMNVTVAIKPGETFNMEEFHAEMDRVYREAVRKAGGFASMEHGLTVVEYKHGKAYTVRTGMEGIEARVVGDKFALGYEMVSTDSKVQHGLSIGALRLATVQGYDQGDIHLNRMQAERLCLEYAATMAGERSVISAGVVREKLKVIGKCEDRNEQENSAPLPDVKYRIDGIIPTIDYQREIVGKDRFVPLLKAMKAGLPDLKTFLAGIGIDLGELPQRVVSLQLAAIDAHKGVDIIDKERALERVERAALIWKGGGWGETSSNDLDEFL